MKVHQRVYALTNFRDVSPRFFYEVFRQYFPETVLYGVASSTVSSLRMHMLADLNLPIPPLEEQRRIVEEIDRETAEIDDMLADITELRDLLAERRAALHGKNSAALSCPRRLLEILLIPADLELVAVQCLLT